MPRAILAGDPDTAEAVSHPTGPFPASQANVFGEAVRRTLARAEQYYRSGDAGVIDLGLRAGLAILAARHIYSDIGRIIEARNWDVTQGRAFTTKARKIWLVARALGRLTLSLPKRLGLRLTGRGTLMIPQKVLTFEDLVKWERP